MCRCGGWQAVSGCIYREFDATTASREVSTVEPECAPIVPQFVMFYKICEMGLLPIIKEDLRQFDKRVSPPMKAAGIVVLSVLAFVGWYLGAEWWRAPIRVKWSLPAHPRGETFAVILGVIVLCYLVSVMQRYLNSR